MRKVPAIDWFYARPGCESCEKTRAELDRRGLEPREERSTKRPLDEPEARALLGSVDEVWIARGAKIDRRAAGSVAVADLRGPTGGIRAPLLRRGRRLLVGYGGSALRAWLDDPITGVAGRPAGGQA
jgi:arsenate reductase-like glutaredoxin family protein